jgi:hypothetical protein
VTSTSPELSDDLPDDADDLGTIEQVRDSRPFVRLNHERKKELENR